MTHIDQLPYLLAEDDDVKVIFQPGDSEFLLITFGDMFMPAEDLRFFADIPVRKLNISCIGFMAKRSNWYPKSSMIPLIEAIRSKLTGFDEIICYGGSMGGYAALKYSRLLASTHVIALCPQWSIDKDECDAVDLVWQQHFNKERLSGMSINSADCSGTAFVFLDTFNKTDVIHAEKIRQVSSAYLIPVLRVDHHVTPALAGTENLAKLISYCRNRDLNSIDILVRQCRRRSKIRTDKIISFAEKRFPVEFCKRIDRLFRAERLPDIDIKYAMIGMRILTKSNDPTRASIAFENYKHKFHGIERLHSAAIFITQSSEMNVYLKTFHDTIVCYDIGSGSLVHCPLKQQSNIETLIPVQLFLRGILVWFFVNVSGYRLYISYDGSDVSVSYERRETSGFTLESKGTSYTLSNAGNYLTAETGTNKINCNRNHAADWELFSIGIR